MPDECTEQETRDVFTAARTEAMTYARPVPVAQVSAALRRRRRVSAVAVAAAVVLAVGGGVAVANQAATERTTLPAAPRPTSSLSHREEVNRAREEAMEQYLTAKAAGAVGVILPYDLRSTARQAVPIMTSGGEFVAERSPGLHSSGAGSVPGDYTIELACAGRGSIRARFWMGPADAKPEDVPSDAADVTVTCGGTPVKASAETHVRDAQRYFVHVDADPASIGHAAFFYVVRGPKPAGS